MRLDIFSQVAAGLTEEIRDEETEKREIYLEKARLTEIRKIRARALERDIYNKKNQMLRSHAR